MLQEYIDSEKVKWDEDVLHSLDLEYHNINPREGLFYALQEMDAMQRIVTDERIEEATRVPPQNTRAKARGRVVSDLIERKWNRYLIDWDWVRVDKDRHLELRNPFLTYDEEAIAFTEGL